MLVFEQNWLNNFKKYLSHHLASSLNVAFNMKAILDTDMFQDGKSTAIQS